MKSMKGWTLLETLITLAIIIIIGSIFANLVSIKQGDGPSDRKPRSVEEFLLDDGTRCVKTPYAITCDWKKL